MLGNAIVVVASDQMWREEEKINRMCVALTGTIHVVHAAIGFSGAAIKDIQSFVVWSDPSRPIGEDGKNTPK
jgi:hypothetical protein